MSQILIKQIILMILIIVVSYLAYYFLNRSLRKIQGRGIDARKKKTLFGLVDNILKYIITIIAIVTILGVFNVDTKTILASMGLLGLILGLALQDIIKAFLAGFFIILDDQYNVGDIVTINGFKGEVIVLGLKSTKLRGENGDIKTISNNIIGETINHTDSKPIAVVDIQVSYNNDLEKVDILLKELVNKLNSELKNIKENITLLSFNSYLDFGVEFRLIVGTTPDKSDEVARVMRKEINKMFSINHISIANAKAVINDGKRV